MTQHDPQAQNPTSTPTGVRDLLSPAGWIVVGTTAVVAVLCVLGLVAVSVVGGTGNGAGSEAGGGSTEGEIRELVEGYMGALEDGDSSKALEIGPIDSTDSLTPLSEETYDAALEGAPMSDVSVDEPVVDDEFGTDAAVTVRYTIHGQSQSEKITVTDYDKDGEWEIIPITIGALTPEDSADLGLTVNGESFAGDQSIALLPGAYKVETDSPYVDVKGGTMIAASGATEPTWPKYRLTTKGVSAFRTAVMHDVEDCLAQDTLKAGCGIGTLPSKGQGGWKTVDGTVKREMSDELERDLETMTPTISSTDATLAEGAVPSGDLTTTMTCERDGQQGECEMFLGGDLGIPTVDLSTPEQTVSWS